jgi:hypothetical protein
LFVLCGGRQVRSKAQGLGPCGEGLRGFESHSPHYCFHTHSLQAPDPTSGTHSLSLCVFSWAMHARAMRCWAWQGILRVGSQIEIQGLTKYSTSLAYNVPLEPFQQARPPPHLLTHPEERDLGAASRPLRKVPPAPGPKDRRVRSEAPLGSLRPNHNRQRPRPMPQLPPPADALLPPPGNRHQLSLVWVLQRGHSKIKL